MLNNLETKNSSRSSFMTGTTKRPRLSLNLHTMPQTVTSNWKKWLFLGVVILLIFAGISFLLYYLAP